jgi:hypothetical protein
MKLWLPARKRSSSSEPFIYKNDIYQDRLGTNIGKTLKKDRFSSGVAAQAVFFFVFDPSMSW